MCDHTYYIRCGIVVVVVLVERKKKRRNVLTMAKANQKQRKRKGVLKKEKKLDSSRSCNQMELYAEFEDENFVL